MQCPILSTNRVRLRAESTCVDAAAIAGYHDTILVLILGDHDGRMLEASELRRVRGASASAGVSRRRRR